KQSRFSNLMSNSGNPVVSVIVPARNEEACLALCLESLLGQTGIDFESIVVDDASTDQTLEIARSFTANPAGAAVPGAHPAEFGTTGDGTSSTRADLDLVANDGTAESCALPVGAGLSPTGNCPGVTVISAPPLLEGWTGKNNAMSTGAKIAKGRWLLFTDADT